ncbi:MAG TPA: DUF1579 family protein [Thermoanaerobaculia bacterium]|nr:DUF1579 family protein [Thermoanaerobaculia bacterium]
MNHRLQSPGLPTPLSITLATCLLLALAVPAALAQEGASSDAEKAMQEMMEAMQQATAPGPHHEALADFVGDWDVELKLVMPGAPAQSSKGRSKIGWLIDGRWLEERIEGELFGQPFESFTIRGFDSYAKNHVAVTVSSFDTAMNMVRGLVSDPSGKTATMYGFLDEYTTGELHKPFKVTSRKIDKDHHVLEIWDLGIGEAGAPVLEYSYTRRKE